MQKTSSTPSDSSPSVPEWLEVVRQKVEHLKFGSVQVVVHEGRVTQVESLEKTRFNPAREVVANEPHSEVEGQDSPNATRTTPKK